MYTKQEIILQSYREGKSQRSIARELQISRRTVKKYIEEYENQLAHSDDIKSASAQFLSTAPVYKKRDCTKLKLTQEIQDTIDKMLEENEQKKHQGLRKQMLKKCDIFEQLNLEGYNIGYTTVCNYIRSKSSLPITKEAFIRQEYQPGQVCEFDWGEVKLYINGELIKYQLAVFTSAYSNYRFVAIYQRQDTLAFMESHVAFFDFTQGVYQQMVYDNMRVAVAKFVGRHEKEPTQALLQLRGHYQFTHRFCNAYRGNEKGHVERSVEYVRRKAFGIKTCFNNQQEAEEYLRATINKLNATKQKLTGKTAQQLFEEETKVLLPSPTKLLCSEEEELRVDKYSTVSYRTNRYSVPDYLVGRFIDAKVSSHQIKIYHDNQIVATHERSYKKHEWVIDIEHYLSTFKKKPGALPGSVALASRTYLKQLYHEYFYDDTRGFIDLLDYCHKNQVADEKLEESVKRILASGSGQITTEQIKVLLGNKSEYVRYAANNQTTRMAKNQLSQANALIN